MPWETLNIMDKPPVGIRPKWVYEQGRIKEILKAMKRYADATLPVPKAWVEELEERMESQWTNTGVQSSLKDNKSSQKKQDYWKDN